MTPWRRRWPDGSPAAPTDSPWSAYLDGLGLMRRGDWVTAARRLEGLRLRLPRPVWEARVQAGAGSLLRSLWRPALAGGVPTGGGPGGVAAGEFALGRALSAARQFEEAVRVWQGLMQRPEAPTAGWLEWAEALLRRPAARPAPPADWTRRAACCWRPSAPASTPYEPLCCARSCSWPRDNRNRPATCCVCRRRGGRWRRPWWPDWPTWPCTTAIRTRRRRFWPRFAVVPGPWMVPTGG